MSNIGTTRVGRIVERWTRSEYAWNDESPLNLSPRRPAEVRAVVASPRMVRSGRAMWNLGMWLDLWRRDLDQPTQQIVLRRVESIMLVANHNRAEGLWKLGDTLGDHLATAACRTVLERVAAKAKSDVAKVSALHGLVHYARSHPRSRSRIERLIRAVKCEAASETVRTYCGECVTALRQGLWCAASDPVLLSHTARG
jgi:hypothetical protein